MSFIDGLLQSISIIRHVGGITFDATFEERHEAILNITDNPVETGVVVSDHAFMSPLKVVITAGVSDTPLSAGGILNNILSIFNSQPSRSRQAFEVLQLLQRTAEPFNVQTGLKLYKNMLVTGLRTSQDKDSSGVLYFEAELREVIIVSTEVTTYPPRKQGATTEQASKTKQRGVKQGSTVTPSTNPAVPTPKESSYLQRIRNL